MTPWRIGAALLVALLVSGCGSRMVVARVNGEPITSAMLANRLAMARVINPRAGAGPARAVNQLIDETLVLNWARAQDLPSPSPKSVDAALSRAESEAGGKAVFFARLRVEHTTVSAVKAFAQKQLILDAVFQKVTAHVSEPSPASILSYYTAHQASFTTPRAVLVREIVVKTAASARSLSEQLRHGASFSALAARDSIDAASRKIGGSLGYVPLTARTGLPKPVIALIGRLHPGQTGIAHTRFGYSIVEVQAERPGRPVPLSNVAGIIRADIVTDRENAVFQQFVKHLRSRSHVVIGA